MINEEVNSALESSESHFLKQTFLAKSEISLIIKNYNDIFSSFDPHPFSERSLSDDFLIEAKRSARDKNGVYELRFLIPKDQRNFEHENLIKRRLRDHFRKHFHSLTDEIRKIKRKSLYMALFGVFLIFIASFLLTLETNNLFIRFIEVLLEPAGWFTAWTGLDQWFYTIEEKKKDLEFYKKMTDAEIKFSSY